MASQKLFGGFSRLLWGEEVGTVMARKAEPYVQKGVQFVKEQVSGGVQDVVTSYLPQSVQDNLSRGGYHMDSQKSGHKVALFNGMLGQVRSQYISQSMPQVKQWGQDLLPKSKGRDLD
jgi:hypothetical protein